MIQENEEFVNLDNIENEVDNMDLESDNLCEFFTDDTLDVFVNSFPEKYIKQ